MSEDRPLKTVVVLLVLNVDERLGPLEGFRQLDVLRTSDGPVPGERYVQSKDPLEHPSASISQVRRKRLQDLRHHPFVHGFQIRRSVNRFLRRSKRGLYRFHNLSGNGIHPLHLANKDQVNLVFWSSPYKGDHGPPNLVQKVLRRNGLVPRKNLVVRDHVAQESPSFPHLVI